MRETNISGKKKNKVHFLRETYQLSPGILLADRYEIEDVLGWGGFGITYLAYDQSLDLQVAVKELFPSNLVYRMPWSTQVEVHSEKMKLEFERGMHRFLEEARNMAQFAEEKHIVHVYNYFQENDTAYLVMEYLEGCTLKDMITEKGGRLPYTQVVSIMRDVLDAFSALHKRKIIHKDISPDNIFICTDGTVKLIDFGAAGSVDEADELTRSVILKPGYAPPEQYRTKGRLGPWTDIYAAGATMYYALTGVVPEESVNREVKDTIVMPQQIVPEIPEYLSRILMKCMAVPVTLRFQNTKELLKKLQKEKKVASVKTTLFRRKLMRVAVILLFLTAILTAGYKEISYADSRQKQASLEPCTITVWTMAEDGAVEEQKERMRTALQEFEETYPFVKIKINAVEESSYREALIQKAEKGELPTVFESDGLDASYDNCLTELSYTEQLLKENEPELVTALLMGQKGIRRLPTSLNCIVYYYNTALMQENSMYSSENNLELFLQEKTPVYIGSLQDYGLIQNNLAGKYEIKLPQRNKIQTAYGDTWSVSSQADEAQKNAGERLLYYLLGERAQDILYVQNKRGIPIEAAAQKIFCEVNPELDEVVRSIEKKGEMRSITADMCEKLYQEEQKEK